MDRLITAPEAAEYFRLPIGTLYSWRHFGTGPRAIKVGKHLRYRESDIEAWLEEQASGDRPAVSNG